MPLPLILGLQPGYFLLFGALTLIHAGMEMTPSVVRKSKKNCMDWRYYYREMSLNQNEEACKAFLLWFILHQHLIPKSSKMMFGRMMNCVFCLPEYNKQIEMQTAYGTIFFTILSADDINIHGFRIAVRRRNWFFGKQKLDNLDRMISFIKYEILEPCRIYYVEKPTKKVKRSDNPWFGPKIIKQMEIPLRNLHTKFMIEERKRQQIA